MCRPDFSIMKKYILFFALIVIAFSAHSQRETRLSFYAQSIQVDNFKAYSISPTIDIPVSDNFNLRYSIGFGMQSSRKFYMHTPLTAPVGSILFVAGLGGNTTFLSTLGLFIIFIPEGVSYDIRLNDDLEISPFIDINSCEFFLRDVDNKLDFLLSGDVGLTSQLYLTDHFYASAHASLTMLETKGLGFSGGIGLGIAFE